MTPQYKAANRVSDALGERNDCTVLTLALVTGASYENAYAVLEELGRERREGVARLTLIKALERLGHTVRRRWTKRTLQLETGGGARPTSNSPMIDDWSHMPTMILGMPQHVGAFKDGEVHDWSGNQQVPIEEAYEVVPITQMRPAPAPDIIYVHQGRI